MTKIFTTHNNFYFVKNFDLQPKAFMSSTKTQIFHHLQQQLLLLLPKKNHFDLPTKIIKIFRNLRNFVQFKY